MEALVEAEQSVKLYKPLLEQAERQVREIRRELDNGFTHMSNRHTSNELRDIRLSIVGVINNAPALARWMSLRDVVHALPECDTDLVSRELRKLARNPRSNIHWNKKRGPASKYARRYPRSKFLVENF